MDIMDMVVDFFTMAGFLLVVSGLYLLITGLLGAIANAIRKTKRRYQIKHRFDGFPTARCYCKDCIWYDEDGIFKSEREGHCRWFDLTVNDDSFCWKADPKGL